MAEEISIKKRLAAGQSIRDSIMGSLKARKEKFGEDVKDTKKTYLTKKGLAKTFLTGNNLASAYLRGKISPKGLDEDDKKSPSSLNNPLSLITKDVSLIRKAVSTLLKFEKETLEQKKRESQIEFLKQQDAKEAALETQRKSPKQIKSSGASKAGATGATGATEGASGGILRLLGGLTLAQFLKKQIKKFFISFKNKIVAGFKIIFSKENMKKALDFLKKNALKFAKLGGRAVAIASGPVGWAILIAFLLGEGIWEAWKKWKESGDLGATIKSFFVGVINGITFGLIGTENIEEGIDKGIELWDRLKAYMSSLGADILAAVKEKFGNVIVSIGKFLVDKTPKGKFIPDFVTNTGVKAGNALIEYGSKLLGESAQLRDDSKAQAEQIKKEQENKPVTKTEEVKKEDSLPTVSKGVDAEGFEYTERKAAKKVESTPEQISYEKKRDAELEERSKVSREKLRAGKKRAEEKRKPMTERELFDEKYKDIIGKDVSNMSDEEIEKLLQGYGADISDFEIDQHGRLQQSGTFIPDSDKPKKLNGTDDGVSLSNAKGSISNNMQEGSITPEPVSPSGSASSGATLSQGSVDVESGQREEGMPSGGNMINSPKINNNQSVGGKAKQPPVDVINYDFTNSYMRS